MNIVFAPVILFVVFLLIYFVYKSDYDRTFYHNDRKTPFLRLIRDKGAYGEYLTYKAVKKLPGVKKWLFNIYIPNGQNETTEIDVLLIHETGLYVFESKNYSGWIFGNEKQRLWTQSLANGRNRKIKNRFLNPCMQNKLHIRCLKAFINDESVPEYSYIVFSQRCELKNVSVYDKDITVAKRNNICSTVSMRAAGEKILSEEKINEIYEKLYPLSHVSDEVKQKHIDDIKKNINIAAAQDNPTEKDIKNKAMESAAKSIMRDEFTDVFKTEDDEKKCPLCGSMLVLRTAKNGERKGRKFWGCSKYPKCRYTENVIEDAQKL